MFTTKPQHIIPRFTGDHKHIYHSTKHMQTHSALNVTVSTSTSPDDMCTN